MATKPLLRVGQKVKRTSPEFGSVTGKIIRVHGTARKTYEVEWPDGRVYPYLYTQTVKEIEPIKEK
jgi:hypothetical protein